MARAFTEQGNRPQAEYCLRRAIELEPASVSLHAGLALNQQLQGKTQEALENYALVLRLSPGDAARRITSPGSMRRIPMRASATGPRRSISCCRWPPRPDSDSNLLDTLAAAYAEAGRFDDALPDRRNRDRQGAGRKTSPGNHRRHAAANHPL